MRSDTLKSGKPFVSFNEKHYTATELGEMWGLHPKTVREIFRNEPGVLVIGNCKSTRYRKAYTTIRIPASVAERVHRKLQRPTKD